jgi:hypothetical protein
MASVAWERFQRLWEGFGGFGKGFSPFGSLFAVSFDYQWTN